jgi:hypothetical protein
MKNRREILNLVSVEDMLSNGLIGVTDLTFIVILLVIINCIFANIILYWIRLILKENINYIKKKIKNIKEDIKNRMNSIKKRKSIIKIMKSITKWKNIIRYYLLNVIRENILKFIYGNFWKWREKTYKKMLELGYTEKRARLAADTVFMSCLWTLMISIGEFVLIPTGEFFIINYLSPFSKYYNI